VGSYDTPGYAMDVAVSGSYAYVADSDSGLRVIDISTPSSPTEVGFYDTPYLAKDVAVSGNYAYVADSESGLRVIDISTPSNPTEVGFYDTPGQADGVAVSGDYAYIADFGGLRVINISSPSNPYEVGYYDTPGQAWGVAVSGGYVCVVDGYAGLQIYENLLAGIDEKDNNNGKVLKITQNLFMGTTEVQVQGIKLPATLSVYDVTGRIVEKEIIYNSSPVTLGSNLTPGIYFVDVKGFESVKITKLR